jgi:hypothetical protein
LIRDSSYRFEAGVPEKKFPNRTAWLIRDSEAGNIRKQLGLRIPKGITPDAITNNFDDIYI